MPRVLASVSLAIVVVRVTAIGGLSSLGIELTQVLMVTRSSSLLDLVLNALGCLAGALLAARWRLRRGASR